MHITQAIQRVGALFVPDPARELRGQLYQILCLASGLMIFGLVTPTNILQGLPAVITGFTCALGALSLVLYAAARQGRYYPAVFLASLVVCLNIAWFPNSGSFSSIPYYFFIPLCYVVFLFDGARRWVMASVVLGNALLLMWLEWAGLASVHPFHTDADRYIDLMAGLVVSGVACAMIIGLVVTGYRRERERLGVTVDALTQSEARFARMFQVNPDALLLVDFTSRRYIDVNEGFVQLTGWPRDEVVGQTSDERNFWVDQAERQRLKERIDAEHLVQGFVAQFRRKDGGLLWCSLSVGLLEYGGRHVLLMAARDVTEQINAQREVAESRAVLATLFNSTDDLVWLVDPTTFALTAFNAAFATTLRQGLGIEARLGRPMEDFIPPDHQEDWRALYRRALEESHFTLEYPVPGTDRVMLHSFSVVRNDGRATGIAVFGKDITELKKAEAQREQMEFQLLEAQKMESLGSLAGGVAHDFNNMLGGIMGYADLLLADETDPRKRDDLEAILQAANRSAELTRKLLAFGRRGKNIVEATDLNTIVREALAMLRPTMRADLAVEPDLGATWTVDGDPAQLSQVVVNLCINANEAMPGGGHLRVRTRSVPASDGTDAQGASLDMVELVVADTGVGMTDEVRARLFEPFFTTKTRGRAPGTGLGLPTVYGVVHMHHGTIDVTSAPGQGAVFTIRLPRGTLVAKAPQAPAAHPTGRGRILVVEDEPLLRKLAANALGKLGYDAITAADGEEGIEQFRLHHETLRGVLLDLKMPRKNGREAFMVFRDIDAAVPVLICSGFGDNEEAQGLITLGAKGLLPKPYRIAQLGEMLSRLDTP